MPRTRHIHTHGQNACNPLLQVENVLRCLLGKIFLLVPPSRTTRKFTSLIGGKRAAELRLRSFNHRCISRYLNGFRGAANAQVQICPAGIHAVVTEASTFTRPAGMPETTQFPEESDMVIRVIPRSACVTLTVAPAITAPCGSTTMPPICPGSRGVELGTVPGEIAAKVCNRS